MLQTNERTINDWAQKLEELEQTKQNIKRNLLRFEEQIKFNNLQQESPRDLKKKSV